MRTRFVLVVGVALMLAGCGLVRSPETLDESRGGLGDWLSRITSTGPQWSDYMPVQNGRVCTYTAPYIVADDHVENYFALIREYTNVHEESDGTHYTAKDTYEIADYHQTPTLEYVLADDGTLRSEPGLLTSEAGGLLTSEAGGLFYGVEGLGTSVDEFIIFPPLDALRQGGSHSSSATVTVRATDPEAQAELEEILQPGESELKYRLDYTVEGVPPKEITTPAGTFTDVVGVSLTYDDIESLNVNAEWRSEMDVVPEHITGSSSTETTWYARDIGLVQEEWEVHMDQGHQPTKLEGCRP